MTHGVGGNVRDVNKHTEAVHLVDHFFAEAVLANSNGQAWEGPLTNNNTRSAPTSVTALPADLRVTSVVPQTQGFSGEQITVQWTVQNFDNTVYPGTRYWTDLIYVSPDATFIPYRATQIGSFPHSNQQPLGSGASYTQHGQVTLPRGISGTRYIYVITDPYPDSFGFIDRGTQAYEGINEHNNLSAGAPLTVAYREPDLKVTSLTVPATPSVSGQSVSVNWTVTNVGSRATREGAWTDRVYLSRDPSLSPDDLIVGAVGHIGNLDPTGGYSQSVDFTLPDGIDGTFYVLVYVDAFQQVAEFQGEGNNLTSRLMPVTLSPPPDLKVTALQVPDHVLAGSRSM